MAPSPPPVPTDALDSGGWREIERADGVAFDAGFVRVETATLVFEDGSLRERLLSATGLDYPWRFFVASRLELRPAPPVSRALTALVADRARAGFADRLADRGLSAVRRADDRSADGAFDGATRASSYDAVCRLGGASARVRGWVAVRPDGSDGSYTLAGGAFPTAVRDAADPETADRLAAAFDADAFEAELFDLIRATVAPAERTGEGE
ncbi:hypothetical protein [Candidatus Halobonum tyrrellensis]|nr:hypothetical protein [Candidatus Halobonum tyrrellensis]